MKNFETQTERLSELAQSEPRLVVPEILCSQNSKVKFVCLKNDCSQCPFMCENTDCQCRQAHTVCFRIQLSSVISGLQGRKVSTTELQRLIEECFQKIIDIISDFRDRIIGNVKRSFEYHGLENEGKTILKAFKSQNYELITSQIIWKACLQTEARNKAIDELKTFTNGVQTHLRQFQSSAMSFCSKIHNQIIPFQAPIEEGNQLLQKYFSEEEKKESQYFYGERHPSDIQQQVLMKKKKKKKNYI